MAINKVTTDVIDMSGNTGGLVWAKGATGDRPLPVDSTAGDLRENTTTGKTEVFNGTEWKNLKEASPPPITVDYLVVAGGGAGGSGFYGAGGGAGGLRTSWPGGSGGGGSSETSLSLSLAIPYDVIVGPGGTTGGTAAGTRSGGSGLNSVFSTITSTGGGGAGGGGGQGDSIASDVSGKDGGSGGGAAQSNPYISTIGEAVTSPVVQGYNGGSSAISGSGGGGGGAGVVGANAPSSTGGNGGDGLAVNIISTTNAVTASVGEVSGSDVYFAGGGGSG